MDNSVEQKFIAFLFRFTPEEVAQTLAPVIRDVLSTRTGGLLTASIIGTLWASSSGVEALRLTLNRAPMGFPSSGRSGGASCRVCCSS